MIPIAVATAYWLKVCSDGLGFNYVTTTIGGLVVLFIALQVTKPRVEIPRRYGKFLASGIFVTLCVVGAALSFFQLSNLGLVEHQTSWHPNSGDISPGQFNGQSLKAIIEAKQNFMSLATGISEDARALVMGLSIGDDSLFSASTSEKLKVLSLTHLSAVSGSNCAIVLGGVLLLLKRFAISRLARSAIALAALVGYVLVVGPQPSVLRSAIMATLVILALASGRKLPPLIALAWSVVIVLLVWPLMAGQLGLLLSVAATAAILILAPRLYARLRSKLPKWLAASLSVTLAAQLWCLPLLQPIQGGLPTYAVLANLLAEPLVAPITVLGILGLIAAALGLPLVGPLTFFASVPAQAIVQISALADLPASTLWWPTGLAGLIAICSLVIACSLLTASRTRSALAVSSVLLVTLGITASTSAASFVSWPSRDWQVVACDVGQGDGIVVRSQKAIALIDVGRDPKPIDECLRHLQINTIDLLVLTHFDADHVAGLAGALRGRRFTLAMLTPFADERPLAASSKELLREASVKVVTGECCLQGRLGAATWQVVEPESRARGSEDSNDGSISMTFRLEGLDLFTFADLGERGQMRAVEYHAHLLNRRQNVPLVVKVSHHGSSDQYPELFEYLKPEIALFSVGLKNSYGHPTERTLKLFENLSSRILRTDHQGSISISVSGGELVIGSTGRS